jgi:antitoxin ParD1/3/4
MFLEAIMATVPKTISVTKKNEAWINARVDSGDFGSTSEYIRDLIRRDEERQTKIEAIRAALIEGEESGISDWSPEDVREAVKNRLRENGQLPLE